MRLACAKSCSETVSSCTSLAIGVSGSIRPISVHFSSHSDVFGWHTLRAYCDCIVLVQKNRKSASHPTSRSYVRPRVPQVLDDDSPKTLLKMLRRRLMTISIDEFAARLAHEVSRKLLVPEGFSDEIFAAVSEGSISLSSQALRFKPHVVRSTLFRASRLYLEQGRGSI